MNILNILFLTAVPSATPVVDTNAEFRLIQDALDQSPNSNCFRLFRHARLRRDELERTLSAFQPHIVHFSGHGSSAGTILLEDPEGRRWDLDRDTLRTVFKAYGQSVQLAVLNACHSEVAGNALREVVPYVIGNAVAVYDQSSIDFATAFYQALFQGKTLYAAFRAGCLAAGTRDSRRAEVPQLLDTPQHPDPRHVEPMRQWVSGNPLPARGSAGEVSRLEVRHLIMYRLKTDSDLDAFALDYFPDVHGRWSSGMDRTAKVNLLLTLHEPGEVASVLQDYQQ